MKTLLIKPPFSFIKGSAKPSASLPIGLLYIAAVLEKNKHNVAIYDAGLNVKGPVYRDPEGVMYMGYTWQDVEEEIAGQKPDIIGINCSFTAQRDSAIKVAEITKGIFGNSLVIVGGNHASARPEDFFTRTDAVDVVCIGEGEYTMLDIAEAHQEKKDLGDIPGIAIRGSNGVKVNPPRPFIQNLDELPMPAYHLIDMDDYFALYKKGFTDRPIFGYPGSERTASIITSRGCSFNCVFCSIHNHMGRGWRYHSAGYVLKHLKLLVSKYRVRHIHFEDDNLTLNIERFKAILTGLLASEIDITWDTPNGIRADTMTKDIVHECKRSGCIYLIFGIESGNQDVLNNIIGKNLNLEKVIRVASWCRDEHIDAEAFFVIGFSGETKAEISDTVEYALMLQNKYDVTPTIFVATPLPGTRLEKLFLEKEIIKSDLSPEELARMTQGEFILDGDTFTAGDVREALKTFYRGYKKNFIKNALLFFVRHPQAIYKFILRLIYEKRVNKEIILNVLQYKNSLLRSF